MLCLCIHFTFSCTPRPSQGPIVTSTNIPTVERPRCFHSCKAVTTNTKKSLILTKFSSNSPTRYYHQCIE